VAHLLARGWAAVSMPGEGGPDTKLTFSLWKILVFLAGVYASPAAFVERLRHEAAARLSSVLAVAERAGDSGVAHSIVTFLKQRREVLY
jgi:hypothetical protein